MKPMKISYVILLKRKKKFYLFLAYLISKHYIAMYHTHHNYFRQLLIDSSKKIIFVLRTFNPLHPNISMHILLTII